MVRRAHGCAGPVTRRGGLLTRTVEQRNGLVVGVASGVLLGALIAVDDAIGLVVVLAALPLLVGFAIRWPRSDAALVFGVLLVWAGVGGRWHLAVQTLSLSVVAAMAFFGLLGANRVPQARKVLGASAMMLAGIVYGAAVGLISGGHGLESVGRDASGYLASWGLWTLALVHAGRLRWSVGVYRRMAVALGVLTVVVLAWKWVDLRTGGEVLPNYGVLDTAQLPVFVAYCSVVLSRRSSQSAPWIAVFTVAMVGLAVTGTRTNLVALVGLPIVLLTGTVSEWPLRKRLAVVGMPLVFGTVLIATQAPFTAAVESRLGQVSLTDFDSDESLAIRLSTYQQLTDRMGNSKVLGDGLGSQVRGSSLVDSDGGGTFTGDTSFASIVKLGALGSVLYLAGIVTMWVLTCRRLDADGKSILVALTAFYVVVSPLRSVFDDPSLGISVALLVSMLPRADARGSTDEMA